jgi:hypothetical protein
VSAVQHREQAAEVAKAAEQVGRSRWLGWAGRVGLAAKGISYALVGVLAIALVADVGGTAASREGALEVVADEWYGRALLLALALGFGAYALWRLAQAVFDREREGTDPPGLAKRLGYAARALLYGALAATTLTLLDGTGDATSQTGEARNWTARVLEWPAGRWLVVGVGLAFIGAALFNAYRAVTQKFEEKWYVDDLGPRTLSALAALSSIGLLARFVAFALIGAFLVKAAYEYDPRETVGLDGALRRLLEAPYGGALLAAVAAGFLCYAIFCFAEARYRRV